MLARRRLLIAGSAVGLFVAALVGFGCKRDRSGLDASVASITTTNGADLFMGAAPTPGSIETVDVEGDRAALVVVGDADNARRPIIHLHGTCAVARTDVESWGSVTRAQGTVIALEGDTACPDGIGGRTWHADAATIEKRIDDAIDAVRAVRGVPLDRDDVVILADDIGAMGALGVAARAPARFSRLVLVGMPETAPAYELDGVKAISILASDREPQDKARRSFDGFGEKKIPAKFWTLPGATHSDYGTSGARTIGEALTFVRSH